MTDIFAQTPEPPYYAVIFTALGAYDQQGHQAMGEKMAALARQQPGYLGIEVAGEATNITVSYWRDLASIAAWKRNAEHILAQQLGRERWYDSYRVRIARVERDYGFSKG